MENQSHPVLFGDWLKARRKALDFTQDELAVRAGCSIFALRKIESGERRPSKQLAGLLACALDFIVPAIADSLGFNFSGPTDLKEQLIIFMASRFEHPLLLLLDNLEHFLSEASGTAQQSAQQIW